MIKVDKNLCNTSYHTMSGHWGKNQLPTPQNPPQCCWIWSGDTSISSSDHVVSDDIKIFAVSLVVFKWRGGAQSAPPHQVMSLKSPSRIGLKWEKCPFALRCPKLVPVVLFVTGPNVSLLGQRPWHRFLDLLSGPDASKASSLAKRRLY